MRGRGGNDSREAETQNSEAVGQWEGERMLLKDERDSEGFFFFPGGF